MYMASYDWRLPFYNLELRDKYFTRMQNAIEILHQSTGEKVVVITHSMGSNVWLYFVQWVKQKESENRGLMSRLWSTVQKDSNAQSWLDVNVEAFINIGGPLLGAPKASSSVVSGIYIYF